MICDEHKLTHNLEHRVPYPSGHKNVSSLCLSHQVKACNLVCYIAKVKLKALRRLSMLC